MKFTICFALLLILAFVLSGCATFIPATQAALVMPVSSPTDPPATLTVTPIWTPTLTVTETLSPITTKIRMVTLEPERILETVQPLLQDPMNCEVPCFWGITPGQTSMEEAMAFFTPLHLPQRWGIDQNSGRQYFSVGYENSIGHNFAITLFTSNSLVENIKVTPEIIKQKEGSPRDWVAYSPETLIAKFGKPSRVELALDRGPNFVVILLLYFDEIDLIALYSGYNIIPGRPHSPRFCPLTAPFDHVRLWMGPNPPDAPGFPTVPLEIATELTIDQFTELMLGNPQQACFTINGDQVQ